jgi:hypothetical protein
MFDALVIGLGFVSFDELPKDERPPKSIWLDGKERKRWFKAVEQIRKEKYGGGSDGDIRDKPIDGPVSHNAAMDLLGVKN